VEKPLDLNPRVKKVGKLYVVRQPSGDSIPANVSMADDRAAREEANRIAAEFDRIDAERETALEAQRAEEKSRREAEEALEADQELAPKFQALLSNTLYEYRKARERGASNPEAEEAFTRQLVAIGKKLGMRNLHPGLLAMHLVRPPVGPLLVKQAQAISGVQEMLQDATREIAPGTLSLREGLSSPAGFLGLDQSLADRISFRDRNLATGLAGQEEEQGDEEAIGHQGTPPLGCNPLSLMTRPRETTPPSTYPRGKMGPTRPLGGLCWRGRGNNRQHRPFRERRDLFGSDVPWGWPTSSGRP
jgi:hypothetical protein